MSNQLKDNKTLLLELREQVNHSSDEQLEDALQEEWLHGIVPSSDINEEDLKRIKREIHGKIGRRRFTAKRILRWTQFAAAIVLPICLVTMLFMYRENQQYASIPMTKITTQEGEQVNITLPDGTVVGINSLSELKYATQSFCQDTREVYFEGEAHYKVAKDKAHPFTIHSQGMDITVLGTEFNFINRKSDNTAEVALIDGSVKLISHVKGNSYTMSPNDVVIVNKKTGDMDIHHSNYVKDATAWQKKQMVFRDVALQKVISSIKKTYGTDIHLENNTTERFTGTLPTNNLDEALKIIKVSYGFTINQNKDGSYTVK